MDGEGLTITDHRRGAVSVGGASVFVFPVVQILSARRLRVFVTICNHQRLIPDSQTSQTLAAASQSQQLQEKIGTLAHPIQTALT